MESLKDRFFEYFGIDEEGYKRLIAPLSFSSIPSIVGKAEVEAVSKRLLLAKERKEKILIYGDYDCDGVMSTSILLYSLLKKDLDASAYLPSRYSDGYGINVTNVERIANKGYKILFTTDNGVTAHDALKRAKELGLETIVLDHHEFDETMPECDYLLHPKTLNYGHAPISAGFLAFLFSEAFLGGVDPYLLVLGGISTVSDAMPLLEENRALLRLALETLNRERYPEFALLTSSETFDEGTIQFEIAPKINAVGRIEKGPCLNRLLPYFSRQTSQCEAIASYLNETNEKRKAIAKEAIAKLDMHVEEGAFVLVADVPEGLNGLLASRLLNMLQKPIAVFSKKEGESDLLVGSLRAPEGFDIVSSLSSMNVPFVAKGGHPAAGGCTIHASDFASFKKEFCFLSLKSILSPKKERAIELSLSEVNPKTYAFLRSFAPFGEGFPCPRFLLKDLDPRTFTYIKDGKYLSTNLGESRLFSFALSKDSFDSERKVNLVGSFKENVYKGRKTINLVVDKAL